uniref:ATP-binding cassette domain-containing protein n=1 Tax=[Mycoplasma] gypis TaxID=92404 RepID=UPI00280B4C10|nr:ATP-binding cassette domain-containing protein [[Mycoplasma] gypis]
MRQAQQKFDLAKMQAKYSLQQQKAFEELKNNQKLLHEAKENLKEHIAVSKNTFLNFAQEFKNERSMLKNSRLLATDLDFYTYSYKRETLNQAVYKFIKTKKSELKYLELEEIKELVKELKKYILSFYSKKLNKKSEKLTKHQIKEIVDQEFNFEYDLYLQKSSENEQNLKQKVRELEILVKANKAVLKDKTHKPQITKEQLQQKRNDYEQAEKAFEIIYENFLVTNRQIVEETNEKIKQINVTYYDLRKKIDDLNKEFKKSFEKFRNYLKEQADQKLNQATSEADKKQIKKQLKFDLINYKTIVENKLETQKSFAIEYKYLVKDIKNIDLLLGIRKNLIDLLFKDRFPKLRYIYANYFYIFFAWFRIQNLLYKTIIYKALEDVGLLKQFAYRYPHEFSGGQRQRIVIARALITQPKVIIADEPIASLDISIQAQVVNLLKDLCKEKQIGLVFIAHDLSMIEYIADRVQIMHLGKIVESGNTEEIYNHPVHPYTINLFKAIPKISNANEKFENVSFELDYLAEQKFPNVPKNFKINAKHFVYGTSSQVKKWTKDLAETQSVEAENNDSSFHKNY